MKRIIALDLGIKSLGICLTDPLQITAQPQENFIFERGNLNIALEKLIWYVQVKKVGLILLGYPLRTDGLKSESTELVEEFEKLIKESVIKEVELKLVDERFSTKSALIAMEGYSSKYKKENKDVVAACLLLQTHLDNV